jgi:multimeric flavodoxin WrbA
MLESAAGLLWITPVYFATVPSQLKAVIDRFQVFWARRNRGDMVSFDTRRPAAALVVGSGSDPFGTEAVMSPLTSASNIAEFNLFKKTVLLGLDEFDAIIQEENADKREVAHTTIKTFVDEVLKWSGQGM